jgi:copper homeostasis protein
MARPILESVVQSVEDAVAAERAGAARLELCVNLAEGGTTPPEALVRAVIGRVSIPVFVMVRPAAVYAIDVARAAGASGIVLGQLRGDRTVAVALTRGLIAAARGLPVTFHRAFDETPDLAESLEHVIEAGAARVLTAGGRGTAMEGVERIAALVAQAQGRITILAGGGVRAHNVAEIIARTGVREVHARFEDEAQTRQLVDLL